MTVGRQTTSTEYDQLITSAAVQMRKAMDAAANLSLQVNGQGDGQAVLEASGYDTNDATAALGAIGYLNTVAQLYLGGATQPSEFNFDQELSQYWGGQ
jgi:hypothetical protein